MQHPANHPKSKSSSITRGPVIIVFGVTGDLSKRKLLPALYHLLSQGVLPPDTVILGLSRRPINADALLETVELCVLEKDKVCDPVGLKRVQQSLRTFQLDPHAAPDYKALKQLLDELDGKQRRERMYYMSIPAKAYAPIIRQLAAHELNDEFSRLLLEKPFGHDFVSAQELLGLIDQYFDETQIYRIDHYLAKETAQNLLAFRLHNPIFSPIWNAEHIERVRIRAFEALAVESRGDFYEQTGALRDLIQSHLMQLLAITLMDLPTDMSSDAIHQSKQHFLEQLHPAEPDQALRGQYDSYRQDVGNPASNTETYARVELQHTAERWQGTTMILETGKAMSTKITDVTVEFKTPHERRRNNLTFRIQPDEGIGLDLVVKEPGFENHMQHAALDFQYSANFASQHVDAYERVLMDALRGDQALFASDREVLATWRVLQPVLSAWQGTGNGLHTYANGSDGPAKEPET